MLRVPGENLDKQLIAELRDTFARAQKKIEHCLDQISDADVVWRPAPDLNSIAIIVNHLCGNLRQWIVAGVGGGKYVRDRPAEFVDPGPTTVGAVREKLAAVLGEVDAALARLRPDEILSPRRIQGFDVTVLHALIDISSHFVGHTHQIVMLTRMRVGSAYRF